MSSGAPSIPAPLALGRLLVASLLLSAVLALRRTWVPPSPRERMDAGRLGVTTSLAHLEGLIERLGTHGELRTHIVLSTQYEDRSVEQPTPERPVTPSQGWS